MSELKLKTRQIEIDHWLNQISMASNTVVVSANITNEEFRALLEDHATLQARVKELEQENAALRAQVERLTRPVSAGEFSGNCDRDSSGNYLATNGQVICDRILAARAKEKA